MTNRSAVNKNFLFIRSLRKHKWGGVEKWMFEVGKGFREKGHKVVYCGRPDSRFVHKAEELSFKTYKLNFNSDINPWVSYRLRRISQKEQIDLICAGEEKELRLLSLAYWFGKRPAIIIRKGLTLVKNRLRVRIVYNRLVDGIITPSKALGENLKDILPWLESAKINVLPNGVAPPLELIPTTFKKEVDPEGKYFLIVVIARFSNQKGHKHLFEALFKIKDKLSDTIVTLVGDGEEKEHFMKIVDKLELDRIVKFVGHRWDIDGILKDADMMIHPSLYEGMPNSVLEALSHSTPILATDIPGVKEIDMGKGIIELVPPANAERLSEKILMLISDAENLKKMGERGRRHVEKHFSMDKMIAGAENIFVNTINSR